MSKPYTEQNLSDQFDTDLIWRRKELSDIKAAVMRADAQAKPALLRALITVCYAHWEGYIRMCANKYFEHLAMRRLRYVEFERQIYVNSFLVRLGVLHKSRISIELRCKLVNDILDSTGDRFGYVNPSLIDTKSNLSADTIKDICLICSVESSHFEDKREFIDWIVVKRRNAIAHGQQEFIEETDIDDLVGETLALMMHFRNLLENKVYTQAYRAV
ncbi:MAG: MAE_28990/MAE_18760 family HEPN-like nuclease [Alphaproteobacteria bacterium]